ncbi:MAG: lipoyl synthase, partial [Alphaproteobacteria bacterium]
MPPLQTQDSPIAKQAPKDSSLRHPEKRNRPDNEILRKPEWIRVKAPVSAEYQKTKKLVRDHKLSTVCEEA